MRPSSLVAVLAVVAGCSSSMSRAEYDKKFAAELTRAKDSLTAIQQHLGTTGPAPQDGPCELQGATVTRVSPPAKAGNLEVMSEVQLLNVLDPTRGRQLLSQRRGQLKSPMGALRGPLLHLANPQNQSQKVFPSDVKAAELSRGVTHVLVSRGGEDEDPQFFLFDTKQSSMVCSFALSIEVPSDIVEEKVRYLTKNNGVLVNEVSGTTSKRKTHFRQSIRTRIEQEMKRRFSN